MCHQAVRQNSSACVQASGHLAAGPVQEDTGPDHSEGDQNRDGDEVSHAQSESAAARDPTEQPEVDDQACGDNGGERAEPNEGVHGLCFSSTGDFVGFSAPLSGSSSADLSASHAPRSKPRDSCARVQDGPDAAAPPSPSSPGAVNGETFEVESGEFHAKTEAAGHERTNGLSSTNSSDHEGDEISEIPSPVESSKLLIHVGDSPNCTENGAYPHLPPGATPPPPCPAPVSALKEFD